MGLNALVFAGGAVDAGTAAGAGAARDGLAGAAPGCEAAPTPRPEPPDPVPPVPALTLGPAPVPTPGPAPAPVVAPLAPAPAPELTPDQRRDRPRVQTRGCSHCDLRLLRGRRQRHRRRRLPRLPHQCYPRPLPRPHPLRFRRCHRTDRLNCPFILIGETSTVRAALRIRPLPRRPAPTLPAGLFRSGLDHALTAEPLGAFRPSNLTDCRASVAR